MISPYEHRSPTSIASAAHATLGAARGPLRLVEHEPPRAALDRLLAKACQNGIGAARNALFSLEEAFDDVAGRRFQARGGARRARGDDLAPTLARFGTELDQMIGTGQD